MDLNGLLSELRRNILRDVSDAISADEADFLWTDASLVTYINDAYFRFCHLTQYIQDASTPEVTEITLVEGVTQYTLHPSILTVLSVELGDLVLPVISTDVYHGHRPDIASFEKVRKETYPGVHAVVPDYDIGKLVIVGRPTAEDAGGVLKLRVTRYPLKELSLAEGTETPEIPSRFHLDMLEWAAYRTLRNHDADGENMAKASAHSTRFERAVEEVKQEFKHRKFARIEYDTSWRW